MPQKSAHSAVDLHSTIAKFSRLQSGLVALWSFSKLSKQKKPMIFSTGKTKKDVV